MWRRLGLWAPVAAYMMALYFLSAQSGLSAPIRVWDKLVHVAAYAILGLLSMRAFHGGFGWIGLRPTVFAVATTMVYGIVDELHQAQVPGRVASLLDWVADAVGALLAVLIVMVFVTIRSAMPGKDALETGERQTSEGNR